MFNRAFFFTDFIVTYGVLLLYCSLSAICDASSKKVRLAMHRTVRNVWGGRLRMERETSRQAGWSCRRPSPRSRWCCRSRSWTATLRHCSRTRRPRPRSCASSCLNGLAWKISSAFHSTSLSLIRSAQLRFVLWYRLSVICWLLCFVLVVLMLLEKHSFFTWKVSMFNL